MKTLVICSGGMDSVALAYLIKKERELTRLVSFDYGQRHKNELQYAANVSRELQVPHSIIDISNISQYLSGSALTDDIDVPDGHYAEENMKTTVVPNRNAIMLSIAFGVAVGENPQQLQQLFMQVIILYILIVDQSLLMLLEPCKTVLLKVYVM